jgi:hypothetical protein
MHERDEKLYKISIGKPQEKIGLPLGESRRGKEDVIKVEAQSEGVDFIHQAQGGAS